MFQINRCSNDTFYGRAQLNQSCESQSRTVKPTKRDKSDTLSAHRNQPIVVLDNDSEFSISKKSGKRAFPKTELPHTNQRSATYSKGETILKPVSKVATDRESSKLSTDHKLESSSTLNRIQKKINRLVKTCSQEQEVGQEFLNEFRHLQLIDEIKQIEESRLCKQLESLENTKPAYLREILHEKHLSRVIKNQTKRQVRQDHLVGIGDPGRLAAKLEKRMYFSEHI